MAGKKQVAPEKVRCYDCRYAALQQWDNNPIIAYCNKNKVRDVAMVVRKCNQYMQNKKEPKVMKLTRIR